MIRTAFAAGVALAAIVAGCGSEPATPSVRTFALKTMSFSGACAGVGLEATVHGDPQDRSVVWLTSMLPDRHRFEVVWPSGYVAVFDPTLRIVDGAGRVKLDEGDYVHGGCTTGGDDGDPLFIPDPGDGFRLECGTIERFACSNVLNAVKYRSHSWPAEPVETFIVRDAAGQFTIVFEDGRRSDGAVSPNF
jgi:hypothetical protein